jgi:hypothetical protein
VIAAYVAGAALVAGIGLGWSVADWRADARNLQRERSEALALQGRQRGIQAASERLEAQREQRGARERIVVKEVERVLEKPVYSVACVDDAGLRILADDIAASNARRQLGPTLPSAYSPDR